MLSRGADPKDIIFANPCKSSTFLEYAKTNGIDLMTFDNEEELAKIQSIYPGARLVLRIKVDDSNSSIRLGLKFGTDMKNVEHLLRRAKDMNLTVVGIAFHVGSGCHSKESYVEAIRDSRIAFDLSLKLGFPMSLLDIGGGFPGTQISYDKQIDGNSPNFEEMAELINQTLSHYYPENDLTIIGEPGRYYCESAFTLVTKITSKNTIQEQNGGKAVMYYLNDGVFGSFLDAVFTKKIYKPIPLLKNNFHLSLRQVCPTILWGPTCDSYDCIRNDFEMHEMNVGEWLLFEDMGSYSLPYAEYGFNGMPAPKHKIFISEYAENCLMKTDVWPKIKSFLADFKWKDIYCEKVWYQMG